MTERFEPEKHLERQIRAFHWVRLLSELPDRSAGSPGEREAGERVATWLEDVGFSEISNETVPGRPSEVGVLALHFGLGLLGCVLGGALGAALVLLTALSLRRARRGERALLPGILPAPVSVNTVARAGSFRPRTRVVLCANVDTTRAGWIFTSGISEWLASWARRRGAARRARDLQLLPEALLFAAAGLLAAGWLGAGGWLLAGARWGLAALFCGVCVALLEWLRARPSPGANANAAGVAALLTCAEQLIPRLPEDVELWAVGAGAGEANASGIRAFLDARSADAGWSPEHTFFVSFSCLGGGALHFVCSEARLGGEYPTAFRELARRVAESGAFGKVTPADLLVESGGRVPAQRGYPTLSLVALEHDGLPRNYRRADDLPDALNMANVIRAGDFAGAVTRAALRGEAGPIAIL